MKKVLLISDGWKRLVTYSWMDGIMERAKELLRSTPMKTAEIANAVGYKDSHYFSFVFKKTQGMSPREYRTGKRAKKG